MDKLRVETAIYRVSLTVKMYLTPIDLSRRVSILAHDIEKIST